MVTEEYAIILGGIDTSVRPFPKPLGEVSGRSMECFVLLGTILLGVCTLGPLERLAPQFAHLRSLSGKCLGLPWSASCRALDWTNAHHENTVNLLSRLESSPAAAVHAGAQADSAPDDHCTWPPVPPSADRRRKRKNKRRMRRKVICSPMLYQPRRNANTVL